ncbi:MAG: hypothetical protein QOI64_1882, partial [Solirubrobacteraceae bacterium]|nr:hypothetical protein [Solirubrobacteraceae bacterium]
RVLAVVDGYRNAHVKQRGADLRRG